ncbi:hypothetical protein F5878DRAFT_606933 [Lentinula raphanica]|uniref:Uncharacterized protein n=1 Tax=Lentinula raphanica TaxID=153919 RepID=A0AA38PGU5_9AGAR|nr:hypothetical protein F5878DRAFT_606933 [Lentinula raphanica]
MAQLLALDDDSTYERFSDVESDTDSDVVESFETVDVAQSFETVDVAQSFETVDVAQALHESNGEPETFFLDEPATAAAADESCGDDSSLEFSAQDVEEDGEDSEHFVDEEITSDSHSEGPSHISAPSSPVSTESDSEVYDSAHGELDEEPTELETSMHVLDAERQRHCAAIAELEERHAKDMIEHAAEVQALRNAQDALREENRVLAARVETLLKDEDELQSQLRNTSELNVALQEEKEQLSDQLLQSRIMIANVGQDHAEALAAQRSFEAQLAYTNLEMEELKSRSTAETALLQIEIDTLQSNAKLEHDNFVETTNALRRELELRMHDLDSERKSSREAAARFTGEIQALTDSRDGLKADLHRTRSELEELSRSSQDAIDTLRKENRLKTLQIQSERARAETSATELRALQQSKDNMHSQCQKLEGTISDLENIGRNKDQELITLQSVLEVRQKLASEKADSLRRERRSLRESVATLQKQLEDAKAYALRERQEMNKKLGTIHVDGDASSKTYPRSSLSRISTGSR